MYTVFFVPFRNILKNECLEGGKGTNMKILYYLGLDYKGYKEQEVIEITDYEADEWISFGLEQGYQIDPTLPKEKQVQMVVDESFREQYNDDRRYFYHTRKFRDIEDKEGNVINEVELIADDAPTPLEALLLEEETNEVAEAQEEFLSILTPLQKKRYLLYLQGYSYRKIAEIEGNTNHNAIRDSIKAAEKKLKKF